MPFRGKVRIRLRRQSLSSWASLDVRAGGQDLRFYPIRLTGMPTLGLARPSAGEARRFKFDFLFRPQAWLPRVV